jgi:hypothetical protein
MEPALYATFFCDACPQGRLTRVVVVVVAVGFQLRALRLGHPSIVKTLEFVSESLSAGKEIRVLQVPAHFDPEHFFHLVKYYAVEIASLVVFLSWLGRAVLRELGYRKKRNPNGKGREPLVGSGP